MTASPDPQPRSHPSLWTVLGQWGRIGCIGFGGPPAHIPLLRTLCVERHDWLDDRDFEDAIAACNLLPGPASTQLAIFCAYRAAGIPGALVGGLAFILPGLVVILALAAVFLAASPPLWILGAGAGAGAAVAAVAARTGTELAGDSLRRTPARWRWWLYAVLGASAAASVGPWLVLVLLACGAIEILVQLPRSEGRMGGYAWPALAVVTTTTGALLSLAWVALKVGALSYGGGFVIIPLMEADAVHRYHWMTSAQFLDAVVLGQVTPGPVVQTVAVVGYAVAGVAGGLFAAAIAFAPSFMFILFGARHFDRLRQNDQARAFLAGAGPAAIGAIIGVAIPLAAALTQAWQYAMLGGAVLALFALRRSVLFTLLGAGLIGALAVGLMGAPLH